MKPAVVALATLMLPGLAHAACEKQVTALEKATGDAVGPAYAAVVTCDAAIGAAQFPAAMKKTAIAAGVVEPVHGLIEQISDYSAKEAVARAVGAQCEDAAVLAFVRGLHEALKDRAFVGWSPALAACPSDELTADLEALAKAPPARTFDDKYGKVVELYGRRKGAASLDVLGAAAAVAAESGPFPVVLDGMVKAVTPEGIGAKPSGAELDALVAALQGVAGKVGPGPAGRVADVLVGLDREDAAASLLPRIHPGKQQPGGAFLYGVAAVEACDAGAVVHWALVEDPSGRWSVTDAAEGKARAFEPRVKGCSTDDWKVMVTPTPVADAKEVEAWVETVLDTAGVADAKLREEKALVLN